MQLEIKQVSAEKKEEDGTIASRVNNQEKRKKQWMEKKQKVKKHNKQRTSRRSRNKTLSGKSY